MGPPCIGLISAWLRCARPRHNLTFQLALGTSTKLLHHSDVSLTHRGAIMSYFVAFLTLPGMVFEGCMPCILAVLSIAYYLDLAEMKCALKTPNTIKYMIKVFIYLLHAFNTFFLVAFIAWTWKEILCCFMWFSLNCWLCFVVSQFWNAVHVCVALCSSDHFLLWLESPDSVHVCATLVATSSLFSIYWIDIFIILNASVPGMPRNACPLPGTTKNLHFFLLFLCSNSIVHFQTGLL